MPNSLRCKVKNLCHKGILNEKDRDRLINGLDCADAMQESSGETVSLEAFKQVMWERNIAIEQLKELGYGFGQKIEPKTGHWIKDTYRAAHCSVCGHIQTTNGQDTTKHCNIHYALFPYCPNCGARMNGKENEQ